MKTFLCVMVRCYTPDWGKFTDLFNIVFANNLKACGFHEGTRIQPLRSQWNHLKHWKDPIWTCVNCTPLAQWAGLSLFVEMIERTAHGKVRLFAQRGVDIPHLLAMGKEARLERISSSSTTPTQTRIQHTPPESPIQTTSPVRSQLLPTPVSDSHVPPPPAREYLPSETPTPAQSPSQSAHYNSTPPSSLPSPLQSVRPDVTAPPLLFRFWDENSGGVNSSNKFVAGMWDQDATTPIPDHSTIHPRIISTLVRMHLTRINVSSAFISLSTSPLGVFHRALRAGRANISILDTSKMNQSHLFSVIPFLRHEPIIYGSEGKSRYFGQGEWLVWGVIPPEAILTTFSTDTLFSISTEYPSIGKLLQLHLIKNAKFNRAPLIRKLGSKNIMADMHSGRSVGQFLKLLNVPQPHISTLAMLFATKWSWRSPGDKRAAFLQGVQRGFISAYSLKLPPPDAESTESEQEEDATGQYYEELESDREDESAEFDCQDEVQKDAGDDIDLASGVADPFATKRASIAAMLKW